MCRLVAYIGRKILLADVVVHPVNSIVKQSLHARESGVPTNGDGFGIGWYAPQITPHPGLFTSIFPAWSDRNLLSLSTHIKASLFFGHVRAASAGEVSHFNCHPFIHKNWMLMHNGGIYEFEKIKRHLRRMLDDSIYHWVKGETDSEHFFALFLQLAKNKNLSSISTVVNVLEETIYTILDLIKTHVNSVGSSYFNICLTDGKRLFAIRHCSGKNQTPESLHYSIGSRFQKKDDKRYHMVPHSSNPQCVVIASERLNDFNGEWEDVPSNHILSIDKELNIGIHPLENPLLDK